MSGHPVGMICPECDTALEGVMIPFLPCQWCGARMEYWNGEKHEREE